MSDVNKQLIYGKLMDIMGDIGSVKKSQTNTHQGFKFRGIDQFVNALHPLLVKHRVVMIPEMVGQGQEIKEVQRSNGKTGYDKHINIAMKYRFIAEDGSSVTVGPMPAEGLDSGDKATTKALSACLKYALIQTFSVPTEDMIDADLESPEINKPVVKQAETTSVKQETSTSVEQTPIKKSSFRKTSTKPVEVSTTNSSLSDEADGWVN